MAIGSMSYTEARDCAKNLGDYAINMENLIADLRNEMNSLEDVLKSNGATQLYETYQTLDAKLNGFPDKVKAFKGFLETAVNQYEADDAALQREA